MGDQEPNASPAETAPSRKPVVRPNLATPTQRITARLVDALCIAIAVGVVSLPFIGKLLDDGFVGWSANQIAGYWTTLVLVVLGYESLMTASYGGTVGKLAVGIRVVDRTAWQLEGATKHLTWAQSALRSIPFAIGMFPVARFIAEVIFAAGCGIAILDEERRNVYDRLAGSVVIQAD